MDFNLLSDKINTVKLGHRSKYENSVNLLNESDMVSSFSEFGSSLSDVNLFSFIYSEMRLRRLANEFLSTFSIRFLLKFKY